MAKLRFSAPGPLARSVGSVEMQYIGPRSTIAGTTASASTIVHVTFNAPITNAFELTGTIRTSSTSSMPTRPPTNTSPT